MNYVKVKRVNLQLQIAKKIMEDSGLSMDDLMKHSKELSFLKQLGIELDLNNLREINETFLNLDKVVAFDAEVLPIPGTNRKGFAVYFSEDPKGCWFLDESDYETILRNIQ